MVYYWWMIKWMKNVINSKEQKFSLRVLVSICLFFCQFQPGIAYKSIAYKKSVWLLNFICLNGWSIEKKNHQAWSILKPVLEIIFCFLITSISGLKMILKKLGKALVTKSATVNRISLYIWRHYSNAKPK